MKRKLVFVGLLGYAIVAVVLAGILVVMPATLPYTELSSNQLEVIVGGDDNGPWPCKKPANAFSPQNCQQCMPNGVNKSKKYSLGDAGYWCSKEVEDFPTGSCWDTGSRAGKIACKTEQGENGYWKFYNDNDTCSGVPEADENATVPRTVDTAGGDAPVC